jgi:transposase InsO family protein
VDGRIRSGRVIEVLSRLISESGAPLDLRSDNGPEFVSRALLKWIVDHGIDTALIDPGKPWQNGAAESFNDICGASALRPVALSVCCSVVTMSSSMTRTFMPRQIAFHWETSKY